MATGTFLLYEIQHLADDGGYQTEESPPVPASVWKDKLYTSLHLTGEPPGAHFQRARVVHRQVLRRSNDLERWLWNGQEVPLLVEEKRFTAHYSRSRALFIPQTEKKVAVAAISSLNKRLRGQVRLAPIRLDLNRIRSQHRKAELDGAWLRRPAGSPIQTQAVFGDIKDSPAFEEMLNGGRLSNVNIHLPFQGEVIHLSLSACGSAYILDDLPLDTCLEALGMLSRFRAVAAPPAAVPPVPVGPEVRP